MTEQIFFEWRPAAGDIRTVFEEEVARAGGTVVQPFELGDMIFLRATMPSASGEVRPGDRVEGGVALRTKDTDVLVHPFVYRLVCQNGAVRAHATDTARISRSSVFDPTRTEDAVLCEIRGAVQTCLLPSSLSEGLREMRLAAETDEADFLLMATPMLAQIRNVAAVREILGTYARSRDRTLFGFLNAITARARETREPELRWRLEELGGAVGALRKSPVRGGPVCTSLVRESSTSTSTC